LQAIPRADVLALFRGNRTEVRVADSSEDILRTLCSMLPLRRQSKVECEQLRVVLLELAARNVLRLEFESSDSPRITAVMLPVADTSAAETKRLNEDVERLRAQVNDLQQQISADKETVDTAEGLIALAETARGEAESKLAGVEAERNEALRKLEELTAQTNARIEALELQGGNDAKTIDTLRKQVRELEQEITVLKDRIAVALVPPTSVHFDTGADEPPMAGCGCKVSRVSGAGCRIPREQGSPLHPFLVVPITPNQDVDGLAGALLGHNSPQED
jgi:chaperonin cofactor prefoldin